MRHYRSDLPEKQKPPPDVEWIEMQAALERLQAQYAVFKRVAIKAQQESDEAELRYRAAVAK